jgi:hypothetical protein
MVCGDGDPARRSPSVLTNADTHGWACERILALEQRATRPRLPAAARRLSRHLRPAPWPPNARRAATWWWPTAASPEDPRGRPGEAAPALASARDRGAEAGEIFEEIVSGRLLATALRQCGRPDGVAGRARHARARYHGAQLELARGLMG